MSDRSDNDSVVETYEEENELEKRTRNRERNKEHARKTRLRKKELIDGLKARVRELEEEGRLLKQQVEACNVASILIGLSTGEGDAATPEVASTSVASIPSQPSFTEALSGGKRKRFLSIDGEETSPPPMELNIKGHIVSVGGSGKNGKMQMNWKTGTYFDEEGKRQRLTESELKALRLVLRLVFCPFNVYRKLVVYIGLADCSHIRRERNRMHAKMTRDRKKCFVASLNRVIAKLEQENQGLRNILTRSREEDEAHDDFIQSNHDHAPLTTQEISATPVSISSSPGQLNKNKTVPQNLQDSSAALMSISNSYSFTVG